VNKDLEWNTCCYQTLYDIHENPVLQPTAENNETKVCAMHRFGDSVLVRSHDVLLKRRFLFCRYDRKTQGGYIFKITGAPISWKSKKQTVVARSTTEAGYLACSEATREAQGRIYLHRDVTGETVVPLIQCDSNGALSTIRSTITSDKAKHIDVPFPQFSTS